MSLSAPLYRVFIHSVQGYRHDGAGTNHSASLPSRKRHQDLFVDIALDTGQISRRIHLGTIPIARSQTQQTQKQPRSHGEKESFQFIDCHVTDAPISLILLAQDVRKQGSSTADTTASKGGNDGTEESSKRSSGHESNATVPYNAGRGERLGRHTIFNLDKLSAAVSPHTRHWFTFSSRSSHIVYQLEYSVRRCAWRYLFQLDSITCLRQNAWLAPDHVYAEVEYNYSDHNVSQQPTNRYHLGHFNQHETSTGFSSHHFSFATMSSFCIRFYLENSVVRYISGPKLLDKWVFRITDHDIAVSEDDIQRSVSQLEAQQQQQQEKKKKQKTEEFIEWRSASKTRNHSLGMALLGISNLMTTAVDRRKSHRTENSLSRRELRFAPQQRRIVQNINIRNGLHTYFIKFTLTKQPMQEVSPAIAPIVESLPLHPSYNRHTFNNKSTNNQVEILIDGLQTFSRYYHYMMQAKESIDILGWEMSLQFGLLFVPNSNSFRSPPPIPPGILHSSWKKYQEIFNWERLFGTNSNENDSEGQTVKKGKPLGSGRWITLQEVLLAKAASGVKIRIMVWRHHILSYLNRFLYLGDFTIEREVEKLQKTASEMGLVVKVYHTDFNLPDRESSFANYPYYNYDGDMPKQQQDDANIVFVIVGNPKGLVSSHHEKTVLIDAEIPDRSVAFIGGFDMARGRFDQPLHQPPLPLWDFSHLFDKKEVNDGSSNSSSVAAEFPATRRHKAKKPQRYGDSTIQPWLRFIRYMWHDEQAFIRGDATRVIHLHFIQRWVHSFTSDNYIVRHMQLPDFSHRNEALDPHVQRMKDPSGSRLHHNVKLTTQRAWPGVLDEHTLLDNICTMIRNAKDYIYMEHQYPFQNYSLAQCMLDALTTNPTLKLIVITCIKTDLPTGFVGSMLDMSQTHINDNMSMLYHAAPDRVGVYGIVRQDKNQAIKSVYIHSKLTIVDDRIMCIGSANLDNLSFYKSSEFNVNIENEAICRETKMRLVCEHLELALEPMSSFEDLSRRQQREYIGYDPGQVLLDELQNDFGAILREFNHAAQSNYDSLNTTDKLSCRLFALAPRERFDTIYRLVNYPSVVAKLLYKLGWDNPQTLAKGIVNNLEQSAHLSSASRIGGTSSQKDRFEESSSAESNQTSRQLASFFIQSRL